MISFTVGETIGIGLGLTAIFITIGWNLLAANNRFQRIEHKVDDFNTKADKIVSNGSELVYQLDSIKNQNLISPDLSTWITNQWSFVQKQFSDRNEKHSICKKITESYVKENSTIILDSGSTVDLITYDLLRSGKDNVTIFSNNVSATMHLVGTDSVQFILLQGRFNDRYAATYSSDPIVG